MGQHEQLDGCDQVIDALELDALDTPLLNTPRLSRSSLRFLKNRSTMFIHEALVAVKCM